MLRQERFDIAQPLCVPTALSFLGDECGREGGRRWLLGQALPVVIDALLVGPSGASVQIHASSVHINNAVVVLPRMKSKMLIFKPPPPAPFYSVMCFVNK